MSAMNGGPGLLLLRHGESTWNVSQRWQGWANPPLSESGVREAGKLAQQLEPFGFTAVCSSDLDRARMTAQILADGLSLAPPRTDSRLRERDVGEWAGLSDAEIDARWPGQLAAWRACDDGPPASGGEGADEVVARMQASLIEFWSEQGNKDLIVVSHVGAIRALDRALGGSGPPIANLAGRWLHWNGTSLRSGELFDPADGARTATDRL